jgi:hypothetical protein
MDLHDAKVALLKSDADITTIMRQALETVGDRGAALRLLLELDESIRRKMFPKLVELASIGHRDIQLVRDVILSLDRDWALEHIPDQVDKILEQAPPPESYEEYRRLAELLDMLHSPYLAALVQKAAQSSDIAILEVAQDFADRA